MNVNPHLATGLVAASLLILAGLAGAMPSAPTTAPAALAPHPAAQTSASAVSTAQAKAVPLRITLEDYLAQPHAAEAAAESLIAPTDFDSIRPGQLLLTTIPGSGTFICSASFVFKDTVANPVRYFLGTAGHCVLPVGAVSTAGVGANYSPSGVTVKVCKLTCVVGGQLSGLIGGMVSIGPVVYARQTQAAATLGCVAGDIGNDFALIEIPSSQYANVRTSMAVWGGPYGQTSVEGTGNLLVHHGNGITAGSAVPTKSRAGVSLSDGVPCSFQALINVAGGDSGSSISLGGTTHSATVGGEQALGTITHGIIEVGTPAFGTVLYRGIQMASVDAGLTVVLCDATTTIPGC